MSSLAIILAAGRSTRMKSDLPKPLHEVAGKPMLGHILDACWAGGIDRAIVVVGHGKEHVIQRFGSDERITFVEQTEQLGTGHAVMVCRDALDGEADDSDVLILAGDLPMITGDIVHAIRNAHAEDDADATLGTGVLDDPTGYGRVVRDEAGNFDAIVEQLDATPEQREVREVFPSLYCVKCGVLLDTLAKLTNDNAKGEYYLTDIYAIAKRDGRRVLAVEAVTADDIIAPNSRDQLADADAAMQDRIHAALRDNGVTIVSSANTYIEADVEVGRNTIIRPFTYIGHGSCIGCDCVVGPFAMLPRQGMLGDGQSLAGNLSPETCNVNEGA
ncbi:MAG: NTP transferase domain-containing protein [Planctomycetota bacterium]